MRTSSVGVAAVLSLMGLAGCNSTEQVQFAQAEAAVLCLQLAARALGLADDSKVDFISEPPGEGTGLKGFRMVSTGEFVYDAPKMSIEGAPATVHVACTGDFNRRIIKTVQVDGVLKRPGNEEWKF